MSVKAAVKTTPFIGERAVLVRRAVRQVSAFRRQRRYHDAFLLNTMRKSGSHYLMSILANYLSLAVLHVSERLDYVAMKEVIWNATTQSPSLERIHAATGYASWRWEHENPLIAFNTARTIVHTYRNPLDAFVSRYFYLYANRDGAGGQTSMDEAIEREIPAFSWHYATVRTIGGRRNVLRVAYEQLVREPEATARQVLSFGGIRPDDELVSRAVEASAPEHVRSDEARHGLVAANLVGGAKTSFIRSGKVGEWKDALDARQLRRIESLLREQRISLDEFVLE